jgi:hypothetical protein
MRILILAMAGIVISGCTTAVKKHSAGSVAKTEYLEITGRRINLHSSILLFADDFSLPETVAENWQEVGDASWVIKNGCLEGKWHAGGKLKHGQLFSRKTFQGDILMEFEAQTVSPSDHDIIWWWGVKLNSEKTHWEYGYLGGLGSWWDNKTGLERIDGKGTRVVMTPLFKFKAGRKYKIRTGMIGGLAFLFINKRLIMEFVDPKPLIRKSPGHIGFGVFLSHIRISNLRVYSPKWDNVNVSY